MKWPVMIVALALGVSMATGASARAVTVDDHSYFANGHPDIVADIGRQAGNDRAQKRAFRLLARLVRRYPHSQRFDIRWSTLSEGHNWRPSRVTFLAAPDFRSLQVEAPSFEQEVYYVGVSPQIIQRAARFRGTFRELGRYCDLGLFGTSESGRSTVFHLPAFRSYEDGGKAVLRALSRHLRAGRGGVCKVSFNVRDALKRVNHNVVVEYQPTVEGGALTVEDATLPVRAPHNLIIDVGCSAIFKTAKSGGSLEDLPRFGAAFVSSKPLSGSQLMPRQQGYLAQNLVSPFYTPSSSWREDRIPVQISIGRQPSSHLAEVKALRVLSRLLPRHTRRTAFEIVWEVLDGQGDPRGVKAVFDFAPTSDLTTLKVSGGVAPRAPFNRPTTYTGITKRAVILASRGSGGFRELTAHGAILETDSVFIDLGRRSSYREGSRATVRELARRLESRYEANYKLAFEVLLEGGKRRRVLVEYSPRVDGGQLWVHEALPLQPGVARYAGERCIENVSLSRVRALARRGGAMEELSFVPSGRKSTRYRVEVDKKRGRIRLHDRVRHRVLWSQAVDTSAGYFETWSSDRKSVAIQTYEGMFVRFWFWREGFPLVVKPFPTYDDYNMGTLWSPDGQSVMVRPGGSGAGDMGVDGIGVIYALRLQRKGLPVFREVSDQIVWKIGWRDRRTAIIWVVDDGREGVLGLNETPHYWKIY